MLDGPGILSPVVMKKMDLTADQQTRVHQIMENHRSTFQTLFQQLDAVRDATAEKFFTAGELSADDLAAQTQQANRIHEQLRGEGLKVELEVRKVLTAEQLTKAAALNESLQAIHAQMRSLFEEQPQS
jgi:Spy/CpxP family protein refolding chaperone